MDAIDQLIEARMKRNLTLEQIARETKIPIRYLEAIENNQLDKLPKSNLTVMYLRSYAGFLQLSPEPILELYHQSDLSESPQSKGTNTDEVSRRGQKFLHLTRKQWIWISSISLLTVIAVAVVTWLFIGSDTEKAIVQDRKSTTTSELRKNTTFKLPTAEERAKIELVEPIELNKKSDLYHVSNVKRLEVNISAKKPTTVEVGQDGSFSKKNLQANENITLSDDQAISIRLSEPKSVNLSVNGVTIEPSNSSKSEVASYRFELQNASE